MSKFQYNDKVICVKNTPEVTEGWVGWISHNKTEGYPYLAHNESGQYAFREDELELLQRAKKEEYPVEEGDICLVDEYLEAMGHKEICVLSVDKNKGRMQFCKWPMEEHWQHNVYQASVNDIAMVLFNRFEGCKKEQPKQEQYTGSSSDYYKVFVNNPTTLSESYYAECNDIIEALEMDFAEGNAFKAIWRKAKARQGVKKKGYDNGVYDSEKVVFFGERMLVKAKNESE